MEFLIVWIVLAIVGAVVASNKGRSGAGWFFVCLILTPLAILILLALPTLKPPEPQPVRVIDAAPEAQRGCRLGLPAACLAPEGQLHLGTAGVLAPFWLRAALDAAGFGVH